jgi:pantoate--beta-alanine ligase
VFVNPTQFNNVTDLAKYPKKEKEDFELLEAANCDVVFAPSANEMYDVDQQSIQMSFGATEQVLEGACRPGHFSGVGVVVSKLLNIVDPDKAYFGQKDLQQVAIIKQLVKALNFKSEIVVVPTIREPDGLAMSSRNLRLSDTERELALNLYLVMSEIIRTVSQDQKFNLALAKGRARIKAINGIELEYLEIVNASSMESVVSLQRNDDIYICGAAYVGQVRIIDNLCVKEKI